jgi:NAD-dependent histone deacetylase SIR2
MDSNHNLPKIPTVSPISTTLKRKRGPSISGDLPVGGKPALKQSKEEATESAMEGLDELEECDSSDAGSDSSGMVVLAQDQPQPTNATKASLILPSDQEALELRARLRKIGPPAFEKECLETKKMDLRDLGTALGVPSEFIDIPDDQYLGFFRGIMMYITNKRQKLQHIDTIDDAARLLQTRNKILVITGAGISTSLGIPDFRSKDTGFYANLQKMGMSEPEEVFDIYNFDENPQTFYSLAGEILPKDSKAYTPTHAFIRALQDQNRLQTNYTQNIDNLEGFAGISPDRLIQCHGSFATASCRKCAHQVPGQAIFANIRAKEIATCTECEKRIAAEAAANPPKQPSKKKHHRKTRSFDSSSSSSSGSSSDDNIPTPGVMKPDITFFGEDLPNDFFTRFNELDSEIADLILVIGTSMQVAPVAKIPDKIAQVGRGDVPCIYIGREPCRHIEFDVQLIGDCDAVVWELARRAGWELKHEMVPKGGMKLVVEKIEGGEGRGLWRVAKGE